MLVVKTCSRYEFRQDISLQRKFGLSIIILRKKFRSLQIFDVSTRKIGLLSIIILL